MKKRFFSITLIVICCLFILPITAYARSYTVGETDLSISIDDTSWYVFTRNNIKNNSELGDLGVTYDYMYDLMHENEIFLDAIVFYENSDEYLELFLRKRTVDDIENLSKYSDDKVLELTKALAKKLGSTDYCIYKTVYKFMKMEYYQSGFYVMEYSTVMNGDNYTLTFQTESAFSDWEYEEMDGIVDSIVFDVALSSSTNNGNSSSLFDGLLEKFISGAVIAAIVGGFSLLFTRKKKGKEENNMGLFSKKKKMTVDDMSMQMMLAAGNVVGKLRGFNDVDDAQSMAVSMGYFYGFLKLHLNSITSLDTANTIINKSIAHLENATKGKPEFENFGYKVRTMANNSSANMQYALNDLKDNPFMGMAVFYLNDLYNSTTIDISKVDVAENNMRMLYGMVSNLTKDIKIIK